MTATSIEAEQDALKRKIKKRINDELWERDDMKQRELAELIHEGESQVNRAINGEGSPKSKLIRKKIFQLFNITDI
ncbi:helix-turn-helix domain-containing protein [Weissella koreensis]|uniref:helix-turn-helix domain-containing protein n=1 Tax=Weissella koreensis TaxID=165096 RepID=UPI000CF302E1|nr:helix-turn-helix transcriptional regulator [Weissella koreensis]AVH74744.1 transcriptional regulator [Weissella koreensis]QGN19968.1 transcriptional regulator [Weissella koreensis]